MKYFLLFLMITTAHAADLSSARFNGRYKAIDQSVKFSSKAMLQGLTCPETLKISNAGKKITLNHPNLRAFDDGRLGQSLTQVIDRDQRVGDCADRDPIACLMRGTFKGSLTKTTTVDPEFIVTGTFYRNGGERKKTEVTLSKMSSFLFYTVIFEERQPGTFEKEFFKLKCSYQKL